MGGEWLQDTIGYCTVAANTYEDPGVAKYNLVNLKINATTGEATHELTTDEMPKHYHSFKSVLDNVSSSGSMLPKGASSTGNNNGWSSFTPGDGSINCPIGSAGSSEAHNNVQPSIGVVRWHRVA